MTTLTTLPGSAPALSLMQQMDRMKMLASAPIQQAQPFDAVSTGVTSDVSFQQVMLDALHHVDELQQFANDKQNAVDSGKSDDLVGAMLASQQAALSFSALVQIRNKVASGVNDLMNMSV